VNSIALQQFNLYVQAKCRSRYLPLILLAIYTGLVIWHWTVAYDVYDPDEVIHYPWIFTDHPSFTILVFCIQIIATIIGIWSITYAKFSQLGWDNSDTLQSQWAFSGTLTVWVVILNVPDHAISIFVEWFHVSLEFMIASFFIAATVVRQSDFEFFERKSMKLAISVWLILIINSVFISFFQSFIYGIVQPRYILPFAVSVVSHVLMPFCFVFHHRFAEFSYQKVKATNDDKVVGNRKSIRNAVLTRPRQSWFNYSAYFFIAQIFHMFFEYADLWMIGDHADPKWHRIFLPICNLMVEVFVLLHVLHSPRRTQTQSL